MPGEDKHVWGFSFQDSQAILQELGSQGSIENGMPAHQRRSAVLCKTDGGGIAARSGTTLSSGTCTVYTATGGSLASTSFTVTVYNLSATAVAASTYIIAIAAGGILIAVWEDC